MFDFPFRNAVICFLMTAVCFQCLFHASVLIDSFQSLHNQLANFAPNSLVLESIKFFYYLAFIFFYLSYWFIVSGVLVAPVVYLGKFKYLRPLLLLWLLLSFTVFTTYSTLDFYIYKYYQFHIGEALLDWVWSLSTYGGLNKNLLSDFSISPREVVFFIWVVLLVFIVFVALMMLAIYLVKRFPFKNYVRDVYWAMGILVVGLLFFITKVDKEEPWLMAQINQYPLLKLSFKQLTKLPFFHHLGSERSVLMYHSVDKGLKQPKLVTAPMPQKPNVLWIVVDTLRYDMVNPVTMPFLNQFQQDNIRFVNHWSSGNCTQPGVMGMIYGLPVNYFSSIVKYRTPPFLFEQFKKQGYELKSFYSGAIKLPAFEVFVGFLPNQLNKVDDAHRDNSDGYNFSMLNDFLKTKHDKPFFTFVMLEAVHNYCMKQNFPLFYKDAPAHCERWKLNRFTDPLPLKKRYMNSVHYIDAKLQEVIETLKKSGQYDNTLIMITSDHGESFNEYRNNIWGHASAFTQEQVKVPLIMHWPGKGGQLVDYQTNHYDIPVTLLQELLHYPYPLNDYMLGASIFSRHPSPFLMVGSYLFMGIVMPNKHFILSMDGGMRSYNQFAQPLFNETINTQDYATVIRYMSKFYER